MHGTAIADFDKDGLVEVIIAQGEEMAAIRENQDIMKLPEIVKLLVASSLVTLKKAVAAQ